MFKHILIPIDGTELSVAALDKSLTLARETGAKVTVLMTIEPAPIVMMAMVQLTEQQNRYHQHAKEQAARHLGDAAAKAKAAGVPCDTVQVDHDHPYQAIIETAAGKGCDLIVLHSHGRKGLVAALLGSETRKVLFYAKIPVMVVR